MLPRTQAGVFRPICDFRGNVLALLDESGDIAESYRYDGFGRMAVFDGTGAELTASAVGNPFGFACKRYDPTTALCHFGARWYDPALGRFLSPDPLGFVDGPNRYAYCGGDPVNFVDPWGLCGEKGYYRVEAPVVGPFGNYYPNRPTWYSRPLADVCNALANLLNLGLLPTEPWRRFDRYAYETWDWYERGADWMGSDEALFLWVALGGTPAAALNAWEHAGYVAANASVAVRAGWAGLAGRVAPKAEALVKYAPDFAAQQILDSLTNVTPGGRTVTAHAAERMVTPPAGRAPTTMAEVDQFLDTATQVRKVTPHPLGDTLTLRNANAPRIKEVVVDAATGRRVITVITPER